MSNVYIGLLAILFASSIQLAIHT